MRLRFLSCAALLPVALSVLPAGAASAAPRPAKAGDFDGDGRRDLVVVSPELRKGHAQLGVVTVRYADGKVRHLATRDGGSAAETSVSADFDRDGYADLAATGNASQGVVVIYGSAKGLSKRRAYLRVPHTAPRIQRLLAVGDFDGNGRPDLAATAGAETRVFLDVRRGAPASTTRLPAATQPVTPVAADVTGDGYDDLYLASAADSDVLLRGGRKGFATPIREHHHVTWTAPVSAATGDFNKDGQDDIALLYGGDTVRILQGYSGGLLHTVRYITGEETGFPGRPLVAHPQSSLAVGDVDRDGRDDLVLGQPGGGPNASGRVVVLYADRNGIRMNRARAFHQGQKGLGATPRADDRFGSAVALVDLSGDRSPELVAAASGEGRIYVLRNAGKRFTPAGPRKLTPAGWGLTGRGWTASLLTPDE
ncbi:FG-GAP-like repeat-containing protein [Actinocorallia aurea]